MDDPIADFIHWYKTRPLITKTFITLGTIQSILISMDVITIYDVYYTFEDTSKTLQIWRPITSLLFMGPLGFQYVIEIYFAYQALVSAELGIFQRKQIANFWYLLMYLFVMITIAASFINLYFIADGFLFALIYVWCKIKPFNRVTLILGMSMQSGYFPWVYLGANVLLGQSFINMVAGFAIAHLYLYIKGSLYQKIGIDLLKTPSLLHSLAKVYNRRLVEAEAAEIFEQNNQNRNEMKEEDDDNLYE